MHEPASGKSPTANITKTWSSKMDQNTVLIEERTWVPRLWLHPELCLKSGLVCGPTSRAPIPMSSAEHQGTTDVGINYKTSSSTHANTHARTLARTHARNARNARRHARARAHENENVIRAGRESTQGDGLTATLGYWLTPGCAPTKNI